MYLYSRYTDNQRAQDALNLTFYHWGLHAWAIYAIVGLTMAFVSHRKGSYLKIYLFVFVHAILSKYIQ